MTSSHPIKVLAVTGGKGGVGKTNVSVNMSLAMAEAGKRVILLDADLGLANVDILLGIKAKQTLADVLEGKCDIRDILLDAPGGIKVIPASSGTQSMVSLSPREHAGLIHAFSELSNQLDVLVVDTAAGISDTVVSFVNASQEVLLVVCDEPSSITDAYALLKLLNTEHGLVNFKVIANMTRTPQEGKSLFTKLTRVTDRFLDVNLEYVGDVPFDDSVRKAVQKQKATYLAYPNSKAAKAYRNIAENILSRPPSEKARGHLEFFIEHLVQAGVN